MYSKFCSGRSYPLNITNAEPATDTLDDGFKNASADIVHNNSPLKNYKGFSIAHLNCCSVLKHLDELHNLCHRFEPHVFSLNETRLSNNVKDGEIPFPGYNLLRYDRNRSGGGVLLAIKNSYNFTPFLNGQKFGIEAISAKIFLGTKIIIVTSIYRPPSSNDIYYENLIKYMEKVISSRYDCIFIGDFNYNTLKASPDLNRVNHICNYLNLQLLVNRPTRNTVSSSTCIDLIFTNIPQRHKDTTVLPVTLSDHFLVHTILNFKVSEGKFRTVKRRYYKHFNQSAFVYHLLYSKALSSIINLTSVASAWNIFTTEFLNISNFHAPVRLRRVKSRDNLWMSQEIQNLIYLRDNLHKRAVKNNDAALWQQYRLSRNNVTDAIRKRKRDYFSRQIINKKTNVSNLWKSLRKVIPTKNNVDISSTELSPDKFNDFFTSVGVKLTKHFNKNILPDIDFQQPSCSFSLSKIPNNFVFQYLKNLPAKGGLDIT